MQKDLPFSPEAEQIVIGSILMEPKCHYVIDKLMEDDFHIDQHRLIFRKVQDMRRMNKPIEIYSVHEEINQAVNLSYLISLVDAIATTTTIEYYIDVLKDRAIKRQLFMKFKDIEQKIFDGSEKGIELKTSLLKSIEDIQEPASKEVEDLKGIMLMTFNNLEQLYQKKNDKRYYTNLVYYDMATAGLHKEEVTTLAARPGVGKSALALQFGKQLSKNGLRVYIVSREMSKLQIGKRLIASETGINGNKLRRGGLNENDWTSISRSIGYITSKSQMFIDTTSQTVPEIRAKVRELKADVLIIDYLQLLRPLKKYNNREQEVSEISRDIKALALEFKIPIVQLAQLNRNAELKRPTKADLRESGSIEQDSDNIVFLHLPTEKEIEDIIENRNNIINHETIKHIKERGMRLVKVIIEKQRDGDVGEFEMIYDPRTLTFYDLKK